MEASIVYSAPVTTNTWMQDYKGVKSSSCQENLVLACDSLRSLHLGESHLEMAGAAWA